MPIAAQKRGFGIADGLILVAAVAAGMALFRVGSPHLDAEGLWDAILRARNGGSFGYALQMAMELGMVLAAPLVAAFTPACLIVQIRRPRLAKFSRRPGFVACLVASVATLVSAIIAVLWLAFYSRLDDVPRDAGVFGCIISMASGSAVLSAWAAMLLCGVWCPSASWQDRTGRLVGAGWVMLGVMGLGYLVLVVF